MLVDLVDHVIGIDPDRDRITASIVCAKTQGELANAEFSATAVGYNQAISWADDYTLAESRVWSIEGAGSYGAGMASTLATEGEWVIEFDRPSTRPAKDGAKSDALDAARAAREVLGRTKWSTPRSRGAREGLRALLVARSGAQLSRTAAINELKALVLTAPVALRDQLRELSLGVFGGSLRTLSPRCCRGSRNIWDQVCPSRIGSPSELPRRAGQRTRRGNASPRQRDRASTP